MTIDTLLEYKSTGLPQPQYYNMKTDSIYMTVFNTALDEIFFIEKFGLVEKVAADNLIIVVLDLMLEYNIFMTNYLKDQ